MEPLLADGDAFTLVEATDFARGDVVVFLDGDGNPVGKRVVAVAGDEIAMVDGTLHIGGVAVPTRMLGPAEGSSDREVCYEEALPGAAPHVIVRAADVPTFDFGPITIPPGHVFVLGDRRDRSNDSRNPRIGAIPIDRVAGHVIDPVHGTGPRLGCPAP